MIVVTGICMGVCTVTDLCKREVPLWVIAVWSGGAFIYRCLWERESAIVILSGTIVGGIVLLTAKLTNEAIGYGDGFVLVAAGLSIGLYKIMEAALTAFFLAALCSVLLLMTKRRKRDSTLPFVPFLMIGFLGGILL